MNLIAELRRRNVIRMAGLYLVGAWLLVQVSSTILPMFAAPDWLPRVIVILMAIGFVPTLIFAWVFELTPEGIKRDADVKPGESIAPQTARRMDRMIIAVLVVALAYFGFDKFVLAPRRDAALIATVTEAVKADTAGVTAAAADPKSIAVLPFVDLSPAHDQQYFSDGMSEEILAALSKVPDLKVAGRTSSFYFKGKDEKLPAIGAALGVASLLEGSVRKQGDKVRISVQLIRAGSGFELWSDSYDGDLKDVFELQERIARAITESLKVVLQKNGERLAPDATQNAEAHQQYLRGRYLWNQRGYNNLRSAEVAFKAALALDTDYADAWAGLAQTYALLPIYVWSDPGARDSVDTYPRAFEAAEHALQLDPKSSAALTARGSLREIVRFDWAGAEADYRAAIAANPRDSTAHQWLGEMFVNERRWAQAKTEFSAALAIDPLSAVIYFSKAESLALEGQPEASLPLFDKALALAPGFLEPINFKTTVLIDLGRYDEAAALASSLPETKRDEYLKVIAALRDPRRKPEAVKFVLEHGGNGVILKPVQLARLGEYELAMTELQKLFAAKAPFRDYLYAIPQFEPLYKDPRFQALLKQIGLPLETGSEVPSKP